MATGRLPDPNTAPLTAKGDLYTYSTVPARLAVGSNGDTLVADSSQTTGLRYNPPVGSLANPIINGGFDIWQRGTSFVGGITSAAIGPDRWNTYRNGAGSTFSRQLTSDTTNLPNIQYCMRIQRDSGNTGTTPLIPFQDIETVNSIPFAGKTITISFYARRGANYSATSNLLNLLVLTGTGTDQSQRGGYTNQTTIINQNATLTTTWERFAFTGTVGATATQLGFQFNFNPTGTAGANDWFEITGVQIDVGTWTASTAPTFRRSGGTLAGELAACQRYYYRMSSSASSSYARFSGAAAADNTIFVACPVFFPVTMRVKPTSIEGANLTIYGGGFPTSVTSVVLAGDSTETVGLLGVNGTGFTQYRTYNVLANNSSSAYVAFNAEL